MKIDKSIAKFCTYFRNQISIINEIQINPSVFQHTDYENNQIRFYKKVLLLTAIDTLAGIRFPKARYPQLNKRNQERFIKFMVDSKSWPDGKLVSIPFLAEHLKTGKIPKGKLSELVSSLTANYFEDGVFNIPVALIDLPIESLLELVTTEQEEVILRENQHYELLYRYRNYLIHESREPGNAMEISPEDNPYYHGYIGDPKLYLAYPQGLFLNAAALAVDYIEKYLTDNALDPYDFVTETTRW